MLDHYSFTDSEGDERVAYRHQGTGEPGSYLEALTHETLRLAESLATLVPPLLDALRNAGDLDGFTIYDLLAEAGITRREPYDPEVHGDGPGFGDSEPGEEIWVLTELGKRFAGEEG